MVKLRVRLGAAEAEVEAEPEHLKEAIDLLPELLKKLPGAEATPSDVPHGQMAVADNSPAKQVAPTSLPSVTIDRSDSLADVISKFFADPWGRERRKLLDVRDVLQSYGLNYPKQSVAVALLRLAKTTKIRRFKAEDGEYVYTAASALSSPLAVSTSNESTTRPTASA